VWGYGELAVASGLAAAWWHGITKFAPETVDAALQRHIDLRELWRAHLRNKGRHGSPAARRLLRVASDGARSEAEHLLVKLLKEGGITGWRTNYPVGGYQVDVAFPKQKVGWASHSDQEDFQNDRTGRTPLRFSAGRCCASPGWI
jgi:hypothetical protein